MSLHIYLGFRDGRFDLAQVVHLLHDVHLSTDVVEVIVETRNSGCVVDLLLDLRENLRGEHAADSATLKRKKFLWPSVPKRSSMCPHRLIVDLSRGNGVHFPSLIRSTSRSHLISATALILADYVMRKQEIRRRTKLSIEAYGRSV